MLLIAKCLVRFCSYVLGLENGSIRIIDCKAYFK